jgi:hypothetical protein
MVTITPSGEGIGTWTALVTLFSSAACTTIPLYYTTQPKQGSWLFAGCVFLLASLICGLKWAAVHFAFRKREALMRVISLRSVSRR